MEIDRLTAEVVAAFDGAGITAILLKGPSIARWLYPTGGRGYGDTDLLVHHSTFSRAESVLRSLGFTELLDGFHSIELDPHANETAFVRPPGPGHRPGGKVDLHRNFPGLRIPDDLLWATLSAECDTMRVGGADVRVLNRTGVALHVLVHAVQHGFTFHTDEDLRRAVEALPVEGWRAVAALGERLGIGDIVALALRRHSRGAGVADRLGLPEPAVAGSPYFWDYVDAPRGAQALSLFRSATTTADKARLVRRALAPSPAKVRYMARRPKARGRSLAVAYMRYWRGVASSLRPACRFAANVVPSRSSLARLRRRSWTERRLAVEALAWLAVLRAALLLVPFRVVVRVLRLARADRSATARGESCAPIAASIGWAVRAAASRTPWQSTCLVQSLAGQVMLALRHQPGVVYIGIPTDSKRAFSAHSWLCSGADVLTGGPTVDAFVPITAWARVDGV